LKPLPSGLFIYHRLPDPNFVGEIREGVYKHMPKKKTIETNEVAEDRTYHEKRKKK